RYIESSSNIPKTMWSIINSKRKNVWNEGSKCNLDVDSLNNFFANVANTTCSKLPPATRDPITFITPKITSAGLNNKYFKFSEVSCVVVRKAICDLKNSKSRDIYDLSVELIKSVKDILTSPLTKLINICIRTNTFPDCLKRALIVPIYKKGDPNDATNYRPISLLPIFSKIFEKILNNQLYEYLDNNDLLSSSQFG